MAIEAEKTNLRFFGSARRISREILQKKNLSRQVLPSILLPVMVVAVVAVTMHPARESHGVACAMPFVCEGLLTSACTDGRGLWQTDGRFG